jgi:hypothetical protein
MRPPDARIAAWAASLTFVAGLAGGPARAAEPYELNVILPLSS